MFSLGEDLLPTSGLSPHYANRLSNDFTSMLSRYLQGWWTEGEISGFDPVSAYVEPGKGTRQPSIYETELSVSLKWVGESRKFSRNERALSGQESR